MCVTINSGRSVTLQDLRITGGSAVIGGGISAREGALTLTRCTVTGNTASSEGGGIYSLASAVTLAQCAVSENSANSGGGISHTAGTLTLDSSHVTNNGASSGGGIFCNQTIPAGRITLQNGSTIANNTASREGGGIATLCPIFLISSSITGNSAPNGGGVVNVSTLTLNNSDIRNNIATGQGGGIYNLTGGAPIIGVVALRNGSAVANNTANATAGSGGGILNQSTVDASGGSITANFPDQCVNDPSLGSGTGCPP